MPARLFAAVYDRALAASEEAGLAAMRDELLAGASGRVVEIGAGTGANVGRYGPGVCELVLCEPEAPMARRLRAKAGSGVTVVEAPAEALPFPDASFDEAVSTLVLCTVPDVDAALRELLRVLRPGGRLRFLEHVRSHEPGLARWQRRLTPVQRVVARGCHLDRDSAGAIEAAGFRLETVVEDRMPKAAPILRPLVRGVALAP